MTKIVQWEEVGGGFKDSLLVGNGASINVHPGFRYESLHEQAVRLGHVDEAVGSVFASFGTTDFELVLRRLWQASLVNQALGIAPGRVETAYEAVRKALIETVRATHVSHAEAKPHLDRIYPFMQQFRTVISLNYDLIVYWAAMVGNQTLGLWFKDAFNAGFFREEWEQVRAPYGKAKGSTLFFYPHGNLVLARTTGALERKIAGNGEHLLEAILARWASGLAIPMFVCEGTSMHKKHSIQESSYLQRVYREVLPEVGDSLVIYGWSLAEQDDHILKQLVRSKAKRIALSVRNDNEGFVKRARDTLAQVGFAGELLFFDSASPGCWNNPA